MAVPDVTVLMPAYNAEAYISAAITSVLNQTYSNFELLIINDCSSDRTLHQIKSFPDPRIRIIENKKQLGLADIRQKGVELSRGRYIAFLDADDIARPDRLGKQVTFFEKHPQVGVIGSWVRVIDKNGIVTSRVWKHAISPAVIPIILLFRNCMTQSSVMVRSRCLPKISFRSDYWAAPDYDLWLRLAPAWQFANIPEPLVSYRVFPESMSFQKAADIVQCTRRITRDGLEKFGIIPSEQELTIHELFERCDDDFPESVLQDALTWCNRLISVNRHKLRYDDSSFRAVVTNYWFKLCCARANAGSSVRTFYHSAPFAAHGKGTSIRRSILRILTTLRKKKVIDITSQDWLRWNA